MAKGLKEYRESSGIEICDVSRATCICSRYIKAIEEGVFSEVPAEIYTRGYIKEYAKYLGVPFPEAIKPYETYLKSRLASKSGYVEKRRNFLQLLSSVFSGT